MITKELADRINHLARKQRDGGLTEEEKEEQKELREIYLANIRAQVVGALESAGFKPKKKRYAPCSCGCGKDHQTNGEVCHDHVEQNDESCSSRPNAQDNSPGSKKLLH